MNNGTIECCFTLKLNFKGTLIFDSSLCCEPQVLTQQLHVTTVLNIFLKVYCKWRAFQKELQFFKPVPHETRSI